jgi:hypothetical protein
MLVATARPLRAPVFARRSAPVRGRAAFEALEWVETLATKYWVSPISVMSQSGGLERGREVATKDKGGSKSRKKAPAKTLKQKRQTKKAKQAGGTAK